MSLAEMIRSTDGPIEVSESVLNAMFPEYRYNREKELVRLLVDPDARADEDYTQERKIREFCEKNKCQYFTDAMRTKHFFQRWG
ncbi:MAG TPA: hypothetical protein VFO76_08945 [Candidatus Kapabacteria bacterium]|nr:hypothetical protein [Candidatus Kapabacteria bacterium]